MNVLSYPFFFNTGFEKHRRYSTAYYYCCCYHKGLKHLLHLCLVNSLPPEISTVDIRSSGASWGRGINP